ncbi:hypothetical protein HYV86_06195 [Candidatus Woesearchaeota archaeon]|nr:hypothetical protein [Candidatus Woesearchaeota archaeon]
MQSSLLYELIKKPAFMGRVKAISLPGTDMFFYGVAPVSRSPFVETVVSTTFRVEGNSSTRFIDEQIEGGMHPVLYIHPTRSVNGSNHWGNEDLGELRALQDQVGNGFSPVGMAVQPHFLPANQVQYECHLYQLNVHQHQPFHTGMINYYICDWALSAVSKDRSMGIDTLLQEFSERLWGSTLPQLSTLRAKPNRK